MEKRVPHYRLAVVRSLLDAGRVRATLSALTGAAALGLDFNDIVDVVRALSASGFHKSMTTHADHRVWQDVYRPRTPAGTVYVKLSVVDALLIVSFKER